MATGTVSAVIRAHQRRLVTFAISLVFAVAALPALAQQQESTQNARPPPYYGYGHMMWGGPGPGWGWHPFMIVGPIFAVLALIGTVVIFVWLVRWATHGFPFHHHSLHHGSVQRMGGSCRVGRRLVLVGVCPKPVAQP